MKATGIVRRIDDLGRIVIPKEIRRTMRIREGDSLEIYTDKDGEVIFKKYSPMGELSSFAAQLCETLNKTTGVTAAAIDRDSVIAAAGPFRRDIIEKRISEDLERLMESRQIYHYKQGETRVSVVQNGSNHVEIAAPIIAEGDVSGCILIVNSPDSTPLGETEYKLVQMVANFLGRQMES